GPHLLFGRPQELDDDHRTQLTASVGGHREDGVDDAATARRCLSFERGHRGGGSSHERLVEIEAGWRFADASTIGAAVDDAEEGLLVLREVAAHEARQKLADVAESLTGLRIEAAGEVPELFAFVSQFGPRIRFD